ncbi:MAG: cytochrome c oxidase subunit 4 [Actinobacteria bacterium]|nr:cytochrome c oxidase subunit 4 [Actinomycetota bacterium]
MKVGYRLFLFLFAFYAIVGAIYWSLGGEPLGITAVLLCAGLSLIIGYYFWFTNRRTGGVLPEDNNDGLISDGAGELGFYSPHSWWPLAVGLAATAAGVGLIIGWWLTLIAVGALLVAVVGFVLEYEKPSASHH